MRKKSLLLLGLMALLFAMLVACNSSKNVKITFDSQGGSHCRNVTINTEEEYIDLPEPTRERYVFTGWYVDAELSQKIKDPLPAEEYPTEDVTYYAGWREIKYTVFFFVENTKIGEAIFSYGEKMTRESYPSLASYPEYEWNYENVAITADRNVFASLKQNSGEDEKIEYSVSFYVSGRAYGQTYKGETGDTVSAPADPTAEGDRYFVGWSLTENGETVSFPIVIEDADVRYYAIFRSFPDSTDYLTYEDIVENGVVTGVRITGLTSVGAYQQEIGIPSKINTKTVTAIGYKDDEGARDLSELRIFKSSALQSVYLPQQLRTIGAWAFADCSALNKVVFRGNGLSYVGQGAFAGCAMLSSFEVTDQVTVLGDYIFSGLTLNKTSEKAPQEIVETLPGRWQTAEWYLTDMAMETLTMNADSTLSGIGSYAFYCCDELTSLQLTPAITEINYLSFVRSGLTSLSFLARENQNKGDNPELKAVDGVVFSFNGQTLYYYPICGESTYRIPAGVRKIAKNAFRGNLNLSDVTINVSVDFIGADAFAGCDNLESVEFLSGSVLETVSDGAFADCPKLRSIAFPARLVNFNNAVFKNDIALSAVTFAGSAVTGIGAYTFYNCVSLTGISMPTAVSAIGEYAFYGCSSLSRFQLATNSTQLKRIGNYAFYNCTELSAVYLPAGLEYIGDYAFCGEARKMKLELTNNDFTALTYIGERAFYNTSILEFTLRGNLDHIGEYAFAHCTLMKRFGFSPSNAYSVVPEGFLYGCTVLSDISFTYNIKEIGSYALYGCVELKTASFNEKTETATQQIEKIGAHAFEGCKKLQAGEGKSRLLPTSLVGDGLGEAAFKDCIAIQSIVIPKDLAVIAKEAFAGCTALKGISYDSPNENALHLFGENCFYGCTSLGSEEPVALPKKLGLRKRTEEGNTVADGFVGNPFVGCTRLTAFSFPYGNDNGLIESSGVVYYRDPSDLYAFPTSKMGGDLYIADTVSYIEDYAFYGATIVKLSFTNNEPSENKVTMVLVEIGDYAFAESSLREVDLASRVWKVGDHAFENCKIGSLTIDDDYIKNGDIIGGVEYFTAPQRDNAIQIGKYAFYHNTELQEIGDVAMPGIPYRVTKIGEGAFASCYNLSDVTFTGSDVLDLELGASVFENDALLTKIVLPARLVSLGEGAFRNCYNLESVYFTTGRKGLTLGEEAFAHNHFLYEITLPSNVVSMGRGAFSDNTRLKYFHFPEELTVGSTLDIPVEAFLNDDMLDVLTIPSYVTSIGERAYYRTHLFEIEFEGGVFPLVIGDYAFAEAVNLESIIIPDNCIAIGRYAFYNAKKLVSVTYSGACYSMTEWVNYTPGETISSEDPCYVKNFYAIEGNYRSGEKYYSLYEYSGSDMNQELYVYSETYGAYVPSKGEGGPYYIAAEMAIEIGAPCRNAYICRYNSAYLTTSPRTYDANVGYYTFAEKEFSGSDGEETYISYQSKNVSAAGFISSFELTIGDGAFASTSLTEVVINGRVKSMGVGVFADIQTLASATVDGVFSAIPEMMFMNDKALQRVEIGDTVDEIGANAFYDSGVQEIIKMSGISERILPIRKIGSYAFCKSALCSITIESDRYVQIENSAFEKCPELTTVIISTTGEMTCGDFAFGDCAKLGTLSLTAQKLGHEETPGLGKGFAYNAVSLYQGFVISETGDDDNYYFVGEEGNFFVTADAVFDIDKAYYIASYSQADVIAGETVTGDYYEEEAGPAGGFVKTTDTVFDENKIYFTRFYTQATVDFGSDVVGVYYEKTTSNDHVLFNREQNTVVFYPAGKTGSFCELEYSVRSIGAYAFYGNKYLTGLRLHYDGDAQRDGLGENGLAETGGIIIYVASEPLARLYKNEWGIDDVQSYTVYLGGFALTLQNSGKYFVSAYLGESTKLVITGMMKGGNKTYEITGIGRDAFKNNKTLQSLEIGAGIKTISNGAFRGCTALEKVFVGANVTGIKNYAFYGCVSLKELTFESDSSVVSIGNYTFAGCEKLKTVCLPEKLETIGSYAFADDICLENIYFYEGLLEVKNNAFEDCDLLRSVVFPASVTKLGSYLFRDCDRMVYIRCLSELVPAIEENTFSGVPAGIFFFVPGKSINKYNVNSKWRNHIEKLISADYIYDEEGTTIFKNYVLEPIENNTYRLVAYIGDDSDVVIYSTVADDVILTAIGENAFGSFVKTVDIRQGVTQIDANAFTYATELRSVTLASSVVSIGTYAFANLSKLTDVSVSGEAFVAADKEAKNYYDKGQWSEKWFNFYVLRGVDYYNATNSYSENNKYFIKETENNGAEVDQGSAQYKEQVSALATIGNYAFYNCTALRSFTFPQRVSEIGKYAFSCDEGKSMGLKSVTFKHNDIYGEKGVRLRINEGAFANNASLLSVKIGCFLTYLGDSAFKNCSNMVSLYLNYNPSKISEDAVVEVPQGVQNLFAGSNKLCVIVPNANFLKTYQTKWGSGERGYNVKQSDINKLMSASMIVDDFLYSYVSTKRPATVTVVAYLGTKTEVEFPSTVQFNSTSDACNVIRIGRENLASEGEVNCSVISNDVTSVIIPSSVKSIGADAFRDSESLSTVTFTGEGLESIDAYAFYGCPTLTTVTIPISISAINEYAFACCARLNGYNEETGTGLYVTDSRIKSLTIGQNAFSDCEGMTSFRMPAQLISIGSYAFAGDINLTSIRYGSEYYLDDDVVLGESDVKLNKIGMYAFYKTAISEIILPETVTVVEQGAFAECQKLLAVYLFRDSTKSGFSDGTVTYKTVFEGVRTDNTKIYVPVGTVDKYKAKDGWSSKQVITRRFAGDYAYEINGGTSEDAVSGTVTLTAYRGTDTELTIPDSIVINNVTYWVTSIASYFGTPNLRRVIFKDSSHAFSIGEYAFAGCTALEEIRLPGADEDSYLMKKDETKDEIEVEIGNHAFADCTSLKDVHLPLYLTYLSSYLFHNCTSLEELTLPGRIGEDTGKSGAIIMNGGIVGNGLFYGCVSLSRLRIQFNYPVGASTPVYGSNVFYQAGENVRGGVCIVVPATYLNNFSNNWIVGRGENFSFSPDNMLYGDYLLKAEDDGYTLLQYRGDADVVPMDSNFSGGMIVSIADDSFTKGMTVSYGDFVLVAGDSDWELVSYDGTEELDFETLTVLGRRVRRR